MVTGQRVFNNKFGLLRLPEGGYGQDLRRAWWCRPPGENAMIIASHLVTEHDDETITVMGTICKPLGGGSEYLLERGIWRLL